MMTNIKISKDNSNQQTKLIIKEDKDRMLLQLLVS